jgi:2,4-dienoyl-CoA reductase-like NADH-dependent reductase (Old Yellow Enzyme family)
MLEVTDAVVSVWGPGRVGMHLAPRADAHDIGDSDLPATFGYAASKLGKRGIAFIMARESLAEPRLGPTLKAAFGGTYIANEGLDPETAAQLLANGEADAAAFGKLFIANPDLPERIRLGSPLNPWFSETFYDGGADGYTNYPALAQAAE